LEAGIFIAVNDAGGGGNALPRAEPRRDPLAILVLDEHVEEALQHEKYLLHFMRMCRVALSGLDIHDREREVSGRNDAGIAVLSRTAGADEAMLRPLEALDLGILERRPIRFPVAESCDVSVEDSFKRSSLQFLRTGMSCNAHMVLLSKLMTRRTV